jgi:hypothetical protein
MGQLALLLGNKLARGDRGNFRGRPRAADKLQRQCNRNTPPNHRPPLHNPK